MRGSKRADYDNNRDITRGSRSRGRQVNDETSNDNAGSTAESPSTSKTVVSTAGIDRPILAALRRDSVRPRGTALLGARDGLSVDVNSPRGMEPPAGSLPAAKRSRSQT